MKLWEILKDVFVALQEDPENPAFWTTEELSKYAYEGLREIFEITDFIPSTKRIPFYNNDNNKDGYYLPPIRLIQRIKNIFWVDKAERENGSDIIREAIPYKLKTVSPVDMNRIDRDWRKRESYKPTHAIIYSGDYDNFNFNDSNFENIIKIKLYPTPKNMISNDLQTFLENQASPLIENNDNRLLFGYNASNLENLVYGLDTNGDGIRDDIPSGTDLGAIYDLWQNGSDAGMGEYFPLIEFIPDIPKTIFYKNGVFLELDKVIPYTLQLALRDYIISRAFLKEGEAQTLSKYQLYFSLFEEKVEKHNVSQYSGQLKKMDADLNFFIETNDRYPY